MVSMFIFSRNVFLVDLYRFEVCKKGHGGAERTKMNKSTPVPS